MMDGLTAYGFLAVTLMLITYALERRSPWFTLAFAGSCLLGSSYGFLQGAWPFGHVESVWSLVALQKWWRVRALEVTGAQAPSCEGAATGGHSKPARRF